MSFIYIYVCVFCVYTYNKWIPHNQAQLNNFHIKKMFLSPLSFLIVFLLGPLQVKGIDSDNVPFEQNYAPLWGQQNMRILNQSREVQLTLDQHSGKM